MLGQVPLKSNVTVSPLTEAVTRMGAGVRVPVHDRFDRILKGVAALRPGTDGRAREALAVGQQMRGVGQQLIVAVTARQFMQAAVADGVGRALRRQIAAAFIRRAHIAQDQFQHRPHEYTGFIELQRRG